MLIVQLDSDKQLELIVKASISVICRFCQADINQRCDLSMSTKQDLFNNFYRGRDDYWPVHDIRIQDCMPLYEASVTMAREQIKQDIFTNARNRFHDSKRPCSDFYEIPGPEIRVDCDYCCANPYELCITDTGRFTKSHTLRLNKYKRVTPVPEPEHRFSCPTCNAHPGQKCRTKSGMDAIKSHARRMRMRDV